MTAGTLQMATYQILTWTAYEKALETPNKEGYARSAPGQVWYETPYRPGGPGLGRRAGWLSGHPGPDMVGDPVIADPWQTE
jgi:hypothetical protein